MKNHLNQSYIFILILFVISVLMFCCSEQHKYPGNKFVPPRNSQRIIDSLITADLDGDGIDEYLLLTKDKNLDSTFNFFKFDLFELYVWNPAKNEYSLNFIDTVYFGTNLTILGKNNRNQNIIDIQTFSGGEDSTLSIGRRLYGYSEHKTSILFSSDIGNPEKIDLDNDSNPEILIKGVSFFKLSPIKPIYYIKDIYKYSFDKYENYTPNYKWYFDKNNNILIKKYLLVKNNINKSNYADAARLFVEICLNYISAGDYNECEKFAESEKYYFKKYNENTYVDIIRILFENGMNNKVEIDSLCNTLYLKAKEYYGQKKYKESEKELLSIIEIDPEFVNAYYLLGDLSLTKKEYDEAISYYQQSSLFTTDDKRLYSGLGKSYYAKNAFHESKKCFEKYLEMDSLSTEAIEINKILKRKEFN